MAVCLVWEALYTKLAKRWAATEHSDSQDEDAEKLQPPNCHSLFLPGLTEAHSIRRVTYSSVCKGLESGCIAPDYRSGQGRRPGQNLGFGSLRDIGGKKKEGNSKVQRQLKSIL